MLPILHTLSNHIIANILNYLGLPLTAIIYGLNGLIFTSSLYTIFTCTSRNVILMFNLQHCVLFTPGSGL